MTKGNRKFNWREARNDEVGFNFAGGSGPREPHEERDDNEQTPFEGRRSGLDLIVNNRMLANDELYISPNEHPGMALTTDLFDGRNYHSWSRAVKRALFARNKLGFIDGSSVEPATDSVDHMQWVRTDFVVFNWLTNSVVKELARGLQNLDTSMQLWEELGKRFGKRNGPRLYKLRREIALFTQKTQSVMVYFNNLSSLWDDLELLRTGRVCICDATNDLRIEMEEMHMMQFLMGLNDVYEPVRQQILILNPLPTVNQAYSMVLEVEEQMQVSSQFSDGVEQSAMYSNQRGSNHGSDGYKRKLTKEEKMKLKCEHCGRSGHLKAECFEIIGVPDWYKKFKVDKGKGKVNFVDEKGQQRQQQYTENEQSKDSKKLSDSMEGISKAIQTEIAKQFANLMKKETASGSGGGMANLTEVDLGIDSMGYSGHYAFGISTDIHKDEWIIDSGASNHMCCLGELLTNIRRLKSALQIYMPDGSSLMAYFVGDAQITEDVKLTNVLYAPEFTHNLLSVGQMARDSKGKVIFNETHCTLQRIIDDRILGIARMKGTLYVFKHSTKHNMCMSAQSAEGLKELHNLFGHPSITAMRHMECIRKRYREEDFMQLESCDVCHRAKQQRNPFPTLSRRSEIMFHVIHVDVWGPFGGESVTNTPYFLTIVDDFTRATWTFLFNSKSQVWNILRSYILMVKTQFKKEIEVMRSDNGSEFVGKQTQEMLKEYGILHQRTCAYTPQQNGVVERKHRHLLQVARALMFQSGLPTIFWPYSVLFATYLINRMPSAVLGWKTPYELLTGKDVVLTEEPRNYKEACEHKEWIEAMDKEIKALEDNKTWEIMQLPEGKRAIGCKWVYKGYKKGKEGDVCKLVKSLYGLKQASREWNLEFMLQVADLFTKSLPGPRFKELLDKLNLGDVHQLQLEGGC